MQERNSSLVGVAVAQGRSGDGSNKLSSCLQSYELFPLVYCTSWQLKSKLSLLPKVLSGHNYHKPVSPERWQYLTALGIWEAFFSLSKQLYTFSWLISSDRLVYPLKNFFLKYPTPYTEEPCISYSCTSLPVLPAGPFLAPFCTLDLLPPLH